MIKIFNDLMLKLVFDDVGPKIGDVSTKQITNKIKFQ